MERKSKTREEHLRYIINHPQKKIAEGKSWQIIHLHSRRKLTGLECSASAGQQTPRNECLQEIIHRKTWDLLLVFFSSSIICLIWQNMFRMKQEVQTNRATLTKNPAGWEGWKQEGCEETSQSCQGLERLQGTWRGTIHQQLERQDKGEWVPTERELVEITKEEIPP